MSRKHRLITLAIAIVAVVGGSFAYATKVLLESKYSRLSTQQQAEFKKQIDSFQNELNKNSDIINSNLKDIDDLQNTIQEYKKGIDELQDTIKQKDELIKTISSSYGADFNPNNVGEVSNVTKATMKRILEGKPMGAYSDIFVDAERQYNVNAIFLAAVCAQESGWGTSPSAVNLNNLSGTYINGKLHYFSSKTESIMFTAKNIAENYLNPKGQFYNGTSIEAINKRYCLNDNGTPKYSWSTNVGSISRGMISRGGIPPSN